MTRSQVELQTQQQRLTAEQAEYAKQKIALARLIGLPSGQDLILTDALPYAPLENLTLEQAIALAAQNRSDLKAAEAQVRAAELSRKAAVAERYPDARRRRGLRRDRRQSGALARHVLRHRAAQVSHLGGRPHPAETSSRRTQSSQQRRAAI